MEMGLAQSMETGFAQSMESRSRGRPGGSGFEEYLLVVYPHGDLQDRLMEAQQQFSSDYGLDHRLDQGKRIANDIFGRNRPHITLATFQAGEEMEDTLIRWIERICQQHRSFPLALNNYSGIPPHTIYLRVQDPAPLYDLTQQLGAIDEFIRSSGWPPVRLTDRPHLSIGGGLTEQVYNKAMPDYSRKTFHGIFRVEELVLLRRKHSFDPCKTVNVFGLKS
jgi:2'-5' RNA ligase